MQTAGCLASLDLVELLDGNLGGGQDDVSDHVRHCVSCAELVSTLSSDAGQSVGDGEEAAPPLMAGDKVGALVVERVLGGGSFGIVYQARDELVGRSVAVKVLDRQTDANDNRYLAELRHLGRIRHKNVATVFGTERCPDGRAAMIMQLLPGPSLKAWFRGPALWRERLHVFLQLAEGLAAIHEAGIVHGDFKPDNVLFDAAGQPVLVDFGLSVNAEDGSAPAAGGTPAYLAPEVVHGGRLDPHADQYAFCLALLEALSGKRPSTTLNTKVDAVHVGAAPAAIEAVLRRGLDAEPENRWPNMRSLLTALRAHVEVVDRMRVNSAVALLICGLAGAVLTFGHLIGPRPGVLVIVGILAISFFSLTFFAHRSRLAARFCMFAGRPAMVLSVVSLIPLAVLFVGSQLALNSFVVAQLLALAIVIPAFSRRSEMSVVLGISAGAAYIVMWWWLGDNVNLPWTNVVPRASLMVLTGLLAWMLSAIVRRV